MSRPHAVLAERRIVSRRWVVDHPITGAAEPARLEAALAGPDLGGTVTVHVVRGVDELDLVVTFETGDDTEPTDEGTGG